MKNGKNKGISLIVLVITIIVMIILAGSIILTLSQNGIIGKANEAVDETDFKQVEQAALLAWTDAYAGGARTQTELQVAVTEALKDVDTSKYKIVVTEKGVTVKDKSKIMLVLDQTNITTTITAGTTEEMVLTANTQGIDTLTWTTTNEDVATVVGNGNTATVTLRGEGAVEIKVTGEDVSAVCTVVITEEIFKSQEVTFEYNSDFDLYEATFSNIGNIEDGKTYVVEWDGTQYTCVARTIIYTMPNVTINQPNAIGNAKVYTVWVTSEMTTTEGDTGEPFLISDVGSSTVLRTRDTSVTHTVRIYEQSSN